MHLSIYPATNASMPLTPQVCYVLANVYNYVTTILPHCTAELLAPSAEMFISPTLRIILTVSTTNISVRQLPDFSRISLTPTA